MYRFGFFGKKKIKITPLKKTLNNHVFKYPTPTNFSYFWNFGFASLVFLALQIITGIFLSMHYSSDIVNAFASIQHIMRDVNYGWLLRYLHSNGASFFFIVVYLHIGRGIYYQRFDYYNHKVWVTGILIFFLMMGTAFIGYVLPWGQMSYWGATVITNLLSAIPFAGNSLVLWIWGGYSVSGPTLSRFFSLHFVLPFLIVILVALHISFLHEKGSSNPSFISPTINKHYLPLYPYFVLKDFVGLFVIFFFFFVIVFFYPTLLGHTDNLIEANPMTTPEHIVPEWYFLPFYAILRSVPNKLMGVIAMIVSILVFISLPYLSFVVNHYGFTRDVSPTFNRYIYPCLCFFFFMTFLLLGWLGAQPAEDPYIFWGSVLLNLYFIFIIVNFFLIYFIKKNS